MKVGFGSLDRFRIQGVPRGMGQTYRVVSSHQNNEKSLYEGMS